MHHTNFLILLSVLPAYDYVLETSDDNEKKWEQRCDVKKGTPFALPEAKDTDSDSKKWGAAAYLLLKFIYSTANGKHSINQSNNKETRFTIVISKLRQGQTSVVAVAGNLGFYPKNKGGGFNDIAGLEIGNGPGQNADDNFMKGIQQVLIDHEILSGPDESFLFLKNPLDKGHMRRHAEIQLTRCAIINKTFLIKRANSYLSDLLLKRVT